MGIKAQDARHCKSCRFRWYAVRQKKVQKPRWFDEVGPDFWTNSQTRMVRLQGNYDRAKTDYDRWAICPNCGSNKVVTIRDKHFVPTNAQVTIPYPQTQYPQYGHPSPYQHPPPHQVGQQYPYGALPPQPYGDPYPQGQPPANLPPQLMLGPGSSAPSTARPLQPEREKWRLYIATGLFTLPFLCLPRSGNSGIYSGPAILKIAIGIVVFGVCWLNAFILARDHFRKYPRGVPYSPEGDKLKETNGPSGESPQESDQPASHAPEEPSEYPES